MPAEETPSPTVEVTPPPTTPAERTSDEDVRRALEAGQPMRVLVVLDSERIDPMGTRAQLTPADAARRATHIAAAKHDLFANAPTSLVLEDELEQLPLATATLTSPDALAHLLADRTVARVVADQLNTISMAQSLPLINQPATALEGKDGTGTAVAVLDTGADYHVADLGSCTAPNTPAGCRVAWAQDFATQDNVLDDTGKHGTNVSSIVATVAPGTKIVALDVFDGQSGYDSTIINAINWVIANRATYNIVAMNLSLGGGSYTAPCDGSPMAVAIDEARRVGVLAAIATGNSAKTNAISSPACASAAVSVGAVYDSNVGALNSSVCSDATTSADKVTCFSNSASFFTLLAPGAFISAGGVSMAGTSQATPHVAGALAVLRGAFPTETMDEIVTRLTASGTPITDARNGIVKPRLDLHAAAAGCVFKLTPSTRTVTSADSTFELTLTTTSSCAWTVASNQSWLTVTSATSGTGSATLTAHADLNVGAVRSGTLTISGAASTVTATVTQGVDTTPPTGTLLINDGDTLTRTLTAALTITGADASGVTSMCVTNTTTCTAFEPFATSKVWTLANTQGLQTVRVFLRDSQGNTSALAAAPSDTITVDTLAPTGGTATAAPGIASTTLTWSAQADATSGLDRYRVVFAPTTAPATCATGTIAYEGTALSLAHTGLTNGTLYAYRVCALDKAGNLSAGVTASATPRPEFNGPVGALTLNGGASYTNLPTVTVTLSPTDESTVTQVCLTTALPCTTWQAMSATKTVVLPSIEGTRVVYALFKDEWTNVSAVAAQASIVLDTVLPTVGTASATYGDASATVGWTTSSDATSGLSRYRVVWATTTAPASCSTGTLLYEGTALTTTHASLINGTVYAYRVCAIDRAGNMSLGATTTTQPRPESNGPVGAFTINGGAAFTKTAAVTLTLSPTDASTVTHVCLTSVLPCTTWQVMSATKPFTLNAPDGNKTVYALFKDQWGNVSSVAAQASIGLDTTLPTTGTASSVYGDASATVSWTASTDATSGLDKYRVFVATTTAPTTCAGTIAYEGTALTFTHASLINGTTYGYRVCALDRAGNFSLGVTTSTQPRPESNGPVGAFTINGGAAYTKAAAVTLTLSPTDASRVTQVCLASVLPCTAWQAFATTMTFALPAPDGAKTVYALFKDQWSNVSSVAAQQSIVLDTTLPTTGTASSVFGDASNTVSWSASSDTNFDKYRVFVATVTAPTTCAGTVAYEGTALTFTHSSLINGTTYGYRVCALDRAGNFSLGVTTSAQPRPEANGPVGAFTINGGAAYTKTAAVTLTLSPTDASTVTQVCLTSVLPCTAWQPYSVSKTFALSAPDGTKTVYALFKDQWNNVSSVAAQQSIVLDTTLPTTGTASSVFGDASNTVSWSASSDTNFDKYRVFVATVTAPTTCAGTVAYEGTALTFTHSSLINGTTYGYRVCALDRAGNFSLGVTTTAQPRPEANGPVGAFTINGGAAYTKTAAVTLTLAPTDASTVTQVCLTSVLPCTTWQPYSVSKTFALSAPDGTKTVFALFKDQWNNVSSVAAQQSIVLDTTLPTTGTASSVFGDASNTVNWSASSDTNFDKYRVFFATVTAPTTCAGTIAYEGTALTFTHASLINGTTYGYRVCALDRAGNFSLGVTTSAQPRPEANGPVGAFTINGGAAYTKTAAVTLTLSPTDASTVTQVCVSTSAQCTAWQTFATTMTFALPAPDGAKTVYALFKDQWNNVSSVAAQQSIVLDTTLPTTGTASSVFGDASNTVNWSASSDTNFDKYRVFVATVTAPTTCAGTIAYEGTALTFTHASLINGTTYGYRVCALDRAGNFSLGVTTTAQPRPEANGPVGAFTINGGAAYTKTAAVTLTLAPTDASRVTQVCLASVLPCTAWQTFATTMTFALSAPDGTKTVYALFKDQWSNVSSVAAQQSIVLDTTLPTTGTASSVFGDASNTVSWSASSDTNFDKYRVFFATITAPTTCAGTIAYEGTALTFTHASLINGTTYGYRVCALDRAGNFSLGVTTTAQPRPEANGPVGAITINAGAAYTKTAAVTLTLSPTDASTVTQVCLSTTLPCTAWQAHATSKTFAFSAPDGTKTVYAVFKDQWNNVSSATVQDNIVLDTTLPTEVVLTATPSAGQVALSWTASTDATSGVAAYKVVAALGTTPPPAQCSAGTVLADGTARTFTHTGLTSGATWAFRVCTRDAAGNLTAGATGTARVP